MPLHIFPRHAESFTALLHMHFTLHESKRTASCQRLNRKLLSPELAHWAHLKPDHPRDGNNAITAARVQRDQYSSKRAGIEPRSTSNRAIIRYSISSSSAPIVL